jgi:hypothetical protein
VYEKFLELTPITSLEIMAATNRKQEMGKIGRKNTTLFDYILTGHLLAIALQCVKP